MKAQLSLGIWLMDLTYISALSQKYFYYTYMRIYEFSQYFCFFLSPSGKLVQIEYALAAVAGGAPSVGIKGI